MKKVDVTVCRFDLQNIKTAQSRNGFSMSATLLINGVSVCDFIDKGDGSAPDFYICSNNSAKDLFTVWEAYLQTLADIEVNGYNLSIDKGLFIDLLHAATINKQDFKLIAA